MVSHPCIETCKETVAKVLHQQLAELENDLRKRSQAGAAWPGFRGHLPIAKSEGIV